MGGDGWVVMVGWVVGGDGWGGDGWVVGVVMVRWLGW